MKYTRSRVHASHLLASTVALAGMTLLSATAWAQNAPIQVYGFNRDVINTSTNTTGASQFDGSGYAYYVNGYNGGTNGLSTSGSYNIGGNSYQFGYYNGNNVFYTNTTTTTSTINLTNPAQYSSLALLATSTNASSNSTSAVTLNYTDGTSTTGQAINAPDWYNTGSSPLSGLQRTAVNGSLSGTPFGITASTIAADPTRTLKSITYALAQSGGINITGTTGVFALSGNYVGAGAGRTIGSSVSNASFQTGSGFTANGTAAFTSDSSGPKVLQLTSATNNQTGSAFSNSLFNVGKGFKASFSFLLTNTTNYPADGITFDIQNSSPTALGGGGGGFGEAGQPGSDVALTFNVFNGSTPAPSLAGLSINGAAVGTATNLASSGFSFVNGYANPSLGAVNVNLSYDGSTLTEQIMQGTVSTTLTYNVNLASVLNGNYGYVGFTGATGGYNAQQDITSFSFTGAAAPEPGALALLPLGLGMIGAVRRRRAA